MGCPYDKRFRILLFLTCSVGIFRLEKEGGHEEKRTVLMEIHFRCGIPSTRRLKLESSRGFILLLYETGSMEQSKH